MTWFRFSIRELFLLAAFVGVGCVLLAYGNRKNLGGGGLALFVFAALVVSVVGAIYETGATRARHGGFFIGCFSYLFLIGYVGKVDNNFGDHFPTENLLRFAHPYFEREGPNPDYKRLLGERDSAKYLLQAGIRPITSLPKSTEFRWVGQLLWSLVIGHFVGLIGRNFYLRGRKTEAD